MKDLEKTLNDLLSEALEEDALENEPAVEKAEEAGHEDGRVEATPVEDIKDDEVKPVEDSADNVVSAEVEDKTDDALPSVDETKKEISDALVGNTETSSIDESFERLNALLDKINEELDLPDGKPDSEDIKDDTADRSDVYPADEDLEKKDVEEVDVDNKDVYNSETEEKDDDVEAVVTENQLIFKILEDAQVLPVEKSENLTDNIDDDHYDEENELVDDSELERKDVYPADEDLEKKDVEEVDVDNKDVYNSETEVAAEEVDSNVVNEALDILASKDYDGLCAFLEDNGYEASEENIAILESIFSTMSNAKLNRQLAKQDRAEGKKNFNTFSTEGKNAKVIGSQEKVRNTAKGAAKIAVTNATTAVANNDRKKLDKATKDHEKAIDKFEKANKTIKDNKAGLALRRRAEFKDTKVGALNRLKMNASAAVARMKGYKLGDDGKISRKGQEINASFVASLSDMDILTILDENGYDPSIENACTLIESIENGYYSLFLTEEDEIKIVPTDPEDEQYDIDKEIENDFDCDGDCEDKDKVKPEDLHEEDDVKPEDLVSHEKEEEPEGGTVDQNLEVAGKSEENEEDQTTKLPVENDKCDSEVKPEDIVVKESVHYSSIKEACMLDEGYFYEDTFLKETAESKQERLIEQVALIMAREAADPLYEELLKSAAYMSRLQEACMKKYNKTAITEAKKIMGEPKETLSENFI